LERQGKTNDGGRFLRLVALSVVAVAALLAVVVFLLGRPSQPAPLPQGAVPIGLRTMPPEWRLPGVPKGCPLAAVSPVRVVRDGETLVFELAEDARPMPLVFPYGFTARLVAGRGELVTPAAIVIAREGNVVSGFMGEAAENGEFILCFDPASELRVVLSVS
jgi:hypothetical protein